MSILSQKRWPTGLAVALAFSPVVSHTAHAEERANDFHGVEFHGDRDEFRDHEFREHEYRDRRFLDSRFHHDHYYPASGFVFAALPPGYRRIYSPDRDFYFAGGVWYREENPGRYVVVAPPIGIAVPVLPPDSTTVLVHGVPYYYANNTYYLQSPSGYLVTNPPSSSDVVELPPGPRTIQPPASNSVIELPPG